MKIDVSIGEVVDKLSILSIKLKKIADRRKLKNIQREYDLLEDSLKEIGIRTNSKDFMELEAVNLKLWDIENNIRYKEAKKEFFDLQPGDVTATYADVDDLTKDVGFKPNTPIEIGIKRFVAWFKEYYGYD